jgi:mxaK protein
MGLTVKRRRELWLGLAAAGLVALIAFDLRQLAQLRAWNRAIGDGTVVHLEGQLPAPLLFARAYHQPPGSDYQGVLALYKRAELGGDPALQAAARYNSGNVYFRAGLAMRDAEDEQQSVPLLELAKGSYRQALKQDPANWDARYNLERVLRQRPEPEDLDDSGLGAPQQAERAATTMRAFSLGLP